MKTKYKTLEFIGAREKYSIRCRLTGELLGRVDINRTDAYMGRPATSTGRAQINMPKSWLMPQDLRDIASFLDQLNGEKK